MTVKRYTMVPPEGIYFNILSTVQAILDDRQGPIVECGVWRGGSSLSMLLAQKTFFGQVVKPVYLFDSFEGLPEVQEIDGPLAVQWQEDKEAPGYLDNAAASIDDVRANLTQFGFVEGVDFHLIKGWFSDTLPVKQDKFTEGIALLRLDGDWYESTMDCLNNLEFLVGFGGTVIIDDYFAWDGCAVAIHEYLGVNKLPYRIRTIGDHLGAYYRKTHRETANEL